MLYGIMQLLGGVHCLCVYLIVIQKQCRTLGQRRCWTVGCNVVTEIRCATEIERYTVNNWRIYSEQ